MEEQMGSQMLVRIDDATKEKFYRLLRIEGKSASEKIREMVEDYITKTDMSPVIDDLWKRMGAKIREKGFKADDIDAMIKDARGSQ
jgi:predicted DNA-binding protein